MDTDHRLLLDIYRAARTLPASEFPGAVMAMLRAALNFDAARLLCADVTSGTAAVQGSIMYNIPHDNAMDWEHIQRQDVVASYVIAHPGEPVAFHCPSLFAGAPYALMRDYVERYEHRNGLVLVMRDTDTGLLDGLSLYRADPDAHFGARERHLLQHVMPHLQEALKLNRQLAAPASMPATRGALLIAQHDGAVQYCAPESQPLMAAEWPRWRPAWLPAALLECLRRLGSTRYEGKHLVVKCQRDATLLFLRVAAPSPLSRLSRRQLQVAHLYSQGLAAKAVASALGITATTARNMLQQIYQKLDVHDKAALARLAHQHEG